MKKKLPNSGLISRLEKIQGLVDSYAKSQFDSELEEYSTALGADAIAIVGTIEQFLSSYYFLANHGVK